MHSRQDTPDADELGMPRLIASADRRALWTVHNTLNIPVIACLQLVDKCRAICPIWGF